MMKRLLTFIFILSIAFTLSSATMYFRYGEEYAYDTNAFSSPLPKNADADYLKKADFLKRHNYGTNFAFDTFFTEDARTGLSISCAFRMPVKSTSFKPEGDFDVSWEYVKRDSLSEQDMAMFFGIGPVFRAKLGMVDLGISIRGSVGSYHFFKDGIITGLQAEPYINLNINDSSFLSFGLVYDAHIMKYIYSKTNWYEENYFMLTAGAYVGIGIKVGAR